ncbi:Adaptin ear-binding coat-associated protein 1 NECAP-1 isoform 1 [Hibiscus syriacus]|uniref:Adaptin ear-binding coat-associated protein 1 NECAP-1 isoform 1 n=1 Tax=Hibiscus syriacus TaxID=106335 RepID=A0A6A2ZBW4_HIBSY|nr:uncharacterized protein LOC120147575 [Hibiscus syriacus]KAE8689237.1 Adaptin ear-binding coat-associated protein 1 NECAP-1 isoform 1 [Hibiscus syriacus]
MITMDLEGITWVGHVYQEFESMCLEAEEVMYKDTVKYVEDQVQTVGASVKKFYADVMQDMVQDLLLPSSLEPKEAVAASNTPVEKNSVTLKKPNVGLKEAAIMSKGERVTENPEVIADVNVNVANVPSFSRLHMDDNIFESCHGRFVERASSDVLSGENSNNAHDKPNIENLPLARTSELTSVENEFSIMPSFSGNANANHEVLSHQSPTTFSRILVKEYGCDSVEEGCNEIRSASESAPEILNDDLQLGESVADKEMEIRLSSYVTGSAESNGQSNNWTMDTAGVTRTTTACRKQTGTVQALGDTPVDESCIMVNGAGLHFHRRKDGKHKPYQKKIRDAISSRMRSARKKEYQQLALWYGDDVESDKDCKSYSLSSGSPTPDILDSECQMPYLCT